MIPQDVNVREMALLLLSPVVAWTRERYPLLHLSPSILVAGERAGPGVMRAGEMSLPVMSCTTWESKPCISSGQLNRADSDGSDIGEEP